jgi:hypothetical protein
MGRDDILQILIENEQGLTAQAVRAEMRGRYCAGGAVKPVLEALLSDGVVVGGVDEDTGARLYLPAPGAKAALMTRRVPDIPESSFFG